MTDKTDRTQTTRPDGFYWIEIVHDPEVMVAQCRDGFWLIPGSESECSDNPKYIRVMSVRPMSPLETIRSEP